MNLRPYLSEKKKKENFWLFSLWIFRIARKVLFEFIILNFENSLHPPLESMLLVRAVASLIRMWNRRCCLACIRALHAAISGVLHAFVLSLPCVPLSHRASLTGTCHFWKSGLSDRGRLRTHCYSRNRQLVFMPASLAMLGHLTFHFCVCSLALCLSYSKWLSTHLLNDFPSSLYNLLMQRFVPCLIFIYLFFSFAFFGFLVKWFITAFSRPGAW